jgi:LysR family transcriptional activator of dmlA
METIKIDDLSLLRSFRAVGHYKSFAKAAQQLGVEAPSISKKISKLELSLGVRLFQRNTRHVTFTEEGETLFLKVQNILEDIFEIENQFAPNSELSGTIRIACLPALANRFLAPLLKDFMQLHPMIKFEMDLSDRMSKVIEERIDVALRVQRPTGADMVFRKLFENQLVFCAAPEYLQLNPAPTNPEQLLQHKVFFLPVYKNILFKKIQAKLTSFIKDPALVTDNGLFLTEMALGGAGIAVRSRWDVRKYLDTGRLVEVLKKYPLENFGEVYLVTGARKALSARVKTFTEYLIKNMGTQ